ncbi:hypothetical protein CC2G_007646 [Coprinopsis cinerea AmutBmut pab1-1]|nr:hypothetical protein CC2G_007646 [Coprinopsis cinerea AmutBmut pab1-1]
MTTPPADLPFTPNFGFKHSVILPASLKDTFTFLGTDAAHVQVCKLSSLASLAELDEKDTVAIPTGKALSEISAMNLPKASGTEQDVLLAHRRHFRLEETVPVLFGLVKSVVKLEGTLTWFDLKETGEEDAGPVYALYETKNSETGIRTWKIRKFEQVVDKDGGTPKTKLSEEVIGGAPFYLKYISQSMGQKAHFEHMESYRTLFQ